MFSNVRPMAAATLPPAESGSWHFEQTARPPASMSLVTRAVAWLAWQAAQDAMSLVTNSGACALFWNISDESAWHLPQVRASLAGATVDCGSPTARVLWWL